jgi:hypothetical protein
MNFLSRRHLYRPSTGQHFASTRTCLIITPATRAQCLPHGKAELPGKFTFSEIRRIFFASSLKKDYQSAVFPNIRQALSFCLFWLI